MPHCHDKCKGSQGLKADVIFKQMRKKEKPLNQINDRTTVYKTSSEDAFIPREKNSCQCKLMKVNVYLEVFKHKTML